MTFLYISEVVAEFREAKEQLKVKEKSSVGMTTEAEEHSSMSNSRQVFLHQNISSIILSLNNFFF